VTCNSIVDSEQCKLVSGDDISGRCFWTEGNGEITSKCKNKVC
jgi:hypothetical protein